VSGETQVSRLIALLPFDWNVWNCGGLRSALPQRREPSSQGSRTTAATHRWQRESEIPADSPLRSRFDLRYVRSSLQTSGLEFRIERGVVQIRDRCHEAGYPLGAPEYNQLASTAGNREVWASVGHDQAFKLYRYRWQDRDVDELAESFSRLVLAARWTSGRRVTEGRAALGRFRPVKADVRPASIQSRVGTATWTTTVGRISPWFRYQRNSVSGVTTVPREASTDLPMALAFSASRRR
jgi:hypothetical protein